MILPASVINRCVGVASVSTHEGVVAATGVVTVGVIYQVTRDVSTVTPLSGVSIQTSKVLFNNLDGVLPWAIPYSSKRIIVCSIHCRGRESWNSLWGNFPRIQSSQSNQYSQNLKCKDELMTEDTHSNPQDSSCPRSRSQRHLPRPRHNPLLQTAGWGWYSSGFWCSWSSNKPSFKCYFLFSNYEKVSMCNVQYV